MRPLDKIKSGAIIQAVCNASAVDSILTGGGAPRAAEIIERCLGLGA